MQQPSSKHNIKSSIKNRNISSINKHIPHQPKLTSWSSFSTDKQQEPNLRHIRERHEHTKQHRTRAKHAKHKSNFQTNNPKAKQKPAPAANIPGHNSLSKPRQTSRLEPNQITEIAEHAGPPAHPRQSKDKQPDFRRRVKYCQSSEGRQLEYLRIAKPFLEGQWIVGQLEETWWE